jgi:hypothetical protein
MHLHRITGTGLGAITELRRMWNEEVLPALRSRELVAGRGIRLRKLPAGTTIEVVDSGGHAAGGPNSSVVGGYSSYFKLTLASSGGAATVTVADGATGGNSYAVVNGGSTYSLPPHTETVSGARVFLLKYTPAQYNSGGQVVSGATMVISSVAGATLPSGGTSGAYYYQLGRTVSSGGSLYVVQDHTAGVAQFQWFANCFLG